MVMTIFIIIFVITLIVYYSGELIPCSIGKYPHVYYSNSTHCIKCQKPDKNSWAVPVYFTQDNSIVMIAPIRITQNADRKWYFYGNMEFVLWV